MFKNAIVFSISQVHARPGLGQIEEALQAFQFVPCGATQAVSCGWVPPRGVDHGALAESLDGVVILKLCTEKKILPGSVVKDRLAEKCAQIEQATGRKPGKKHQKELKEAVILELLPMAFTKREFALAWLDFKSGFAVLDLSSVSKADDFVTMLIKSFAEKNLALAIAGVHTETSPAVAMATWLKDQDIVPSSFTVDRECELRTVDEMRSKVKYSSHALDIKEVVAHIEQGKMPTRLALTWNSRVSFELSDNLQLRKLSFLDVVFENRQDQKEEAFDADFAILTGEITPLFRDLVEALGGIAPIECPSSPSDGNAKDDAKLAVNEAALA